MCPTDLANSIFINDLFEPDNVSIPVIVFWLTSSKSIGSLNSLIDSCYSIEDNAISPELGDEEANIYSKLYLLNYYDRVIKNFTGAGGYDLDKVLQFKEGNRTTIIANRNDGAKLYQQLKKDLSKELMMMVQLYKLNRSAPRQSIVMDDFCEGYNGAHYYDSDWRRDY